MVPQVEEVLITSKDGEEVAERIKSMISAIFAQLRELYPQKKRVIKLDTKKKEELPAEKNEDVFSRIKPKLGEKRTYINKSIDELLQEEEQTEGAAEGSELRKNRVTRFKLNDNNQVEEREPKRSKSQRQQKCKYFPDCSKGDTCTYFHPKEECKNFPSCSYGETCMFLHPKIECKFGSSCNR